MSQMELEIRKFAFPPWDLQQFAFITALHEAVDRVPAAVRVTTVWLLPLQ